MASESPHLGPFADWPGVAIADRGLYGRPASWVDFRAAVRSLLDADGETEPPADVRVESTWEAGGVAGEEVSWSVGWGPRTHAYVLRPAQVDGPLPGVVALHSHDGVKTFGKEKIADGPDGSEPGVRALRETAYGGRAFADALARRGHVVLAHDVFLWGSRGFDVPTMLAGLPYEQPSARRDDETDPAYADRVATSHEHLIAKYCTQLGTSVAAVIGHEDRLAAAYLRARSDVADGGIAAVGLSGGGARAAVLAATDDGLAAAVIAGMMTTHQAMLDRHVAGHSWAFHVPGLSRLGDWPDVAACRAPMPLLVQYLRDDYLFPIDGMRAADERIAARYAEVGSASAYTGTFFPGDHRFDVPMQEAAFDWLAGHFAR